jgi:hypothetical protein
MSVEGVKMSYNKMYDLIIRQAVAGLIVLRNGNHVFVSFRGLRKSYLTMLPEHVTCFNNLVSSDVIIPSKRDNTPVEVNYQAAEEFLRLRSFLYE